MAKRNSTPLIDNIDLLRNAVRQVRQRHPFDIIAWVLLLDHLHAIWTLPPKDTDYPMRWRQIKANFSRYLPQGEHIRPSRIMKGERGIWQRRYWEHTIRDEIDLRRCLDYIHFKPVKHGYVHKVSDWPYSTFHHHIEKGVYPPDWGW